MNKSLATSQDVPTHRLTLKLEDGTYRRFYLNRAEADWLNKAIHGVDPFISLPLSVDPKAPSFYPKRGAWMEAMSTQEIQARRDRHAGAVEDAKDREDEAQKAEESRELRAWVEDNPASFENLKDEARRLLEGQGGMYMNASKKTKESLVWYRAMALAAEHIASQKSFV